MTATLIVDDLYRVDVNHTSCNLTSLETWHQRLGHLSEANLKTLSKMVDGMKIDTTSFPTCVTCSKGKQSRSKHKKNDRIRTAAIGEIVHTDLWGPMEPLSLGGAKYYLSFVDDFSRKSFVFFIKKKSQVSDIFRSFNVWFKTQSGKPIKMLRSDRGGEYLSKPFPNIAPKMASFNRSHLVILLNKMVLPRD
jgi:transposase InsO family protein